MTAIQQIISRPIQLSSLAAALLCCAALAQPAAAQFPSDAAASPEQRDKQYDALARDAAQIEQFGGVLKKVVKVVSPTVVHIEAQKPDPAAKRYTHAAIEEAGSGTIIQLNDKFYILTNRHVIKAATVGNISIKLHDGRLIHPTTVWSDPGTDVAIMAISASDLVPARLGDSDKVEIGDFVLAVGSPFGLSHSVTFGIISAKARRDLELGDDNIEFQDFLQTDAAINPGNSGGPLLNLRGEVVGMNTAIASNSGGSEGIGFTIPINMAMNIARQLVARGSVVRAFLGVTLDPTFTEPAAEKLGLPRVEGCRITAITAKSPAEAAHLRVDDVILEFNGDRIDSDAHLIDLVSLTEVGREVPLTVFRDRKVVRLMVKVGDRSKFEATE